MKTTIIELKAPYQGFGYITIPKGTRVTTRRRISEDGDYHEVTDLNRVMHNTIEMSEKEKTDFERSIIYHPIRVPAKYVQ